MQYSVRDFLNMGSTYDMKAEDIKDNIEKPKEQTQEDTNLNTEQPKLENTNPNTEQPEAPKEEGVNKKEMELMRKSYSEINTLLYPFIIDVLSEFEYIGSPIYSRIGIDKESISQMIDRVIDLAEESLDQVGEVKNERTGNYLRNWDRWGLLRAAVESLLLNDIFAIRRPIYFKKQKK